MLTITELFSKVRESHIRAGSHRLQSLLNENYFHVLSSAPLILVGGTNGKGSTCAFLESIFRHSGFKTGLYTSPHLVNVSERIRISGVPVFEKEILDTIEKLDTNRQLFLPDATFFELMTAAAAILFYEKKVDIIICEVGLGGRYDSTNAFSPLLSVLTGVSLDHTHILGTDVAKIAKDKSYIARRNKPFVVNSSVPQKVRKSVCETADILGNKIVWTSKKLHKSLEKIFTENIHHKAKTNLRTALAVVDCLMENGNFVFKAQNDISSRGLNTESIRKGIKKTFWPGRFDVREINNQTVIFDCAHNPGGIEFFLKQYSKSKFKNQKYSLVFSSLNDKDWKKNISLLAPFAQNVQIIQIENERAQDAHSISSFLKNEFASLNVNVELELKKSFPEILNTSQKNPVLVIGSIAFVGAMFESMHLNVFPT